MIFVCDGSAPTKLYTLSLHDALPIFSGGSAGRVPGGGGDRGRAAGGGDLPGHRPPARRLLRVSVPGAETRSSRRAGRSEEHTSELQSRRDLVCRLLLEKKNRTRRGDC